MSLTEVDIGYAVKLYAEGRTTREIASMLGTNYGSVGAALKKSGIQLRPRGRKAEFPTERRCTFCASVKPIDSFERNSGLKCGYGYLCKPCAASKAKAYTHRRYGLSKKHYEELLRQQQNRCGICGTTVEMLKRRLNIDHDHTTGKVRGLLCDNCNLGLGFFIDDPDRLKKAIQYLESFTEVL